MNHRAIRVLTGMTTVALMAMGGTFALWSAQQDISGGNISTGNLDIWLGMGPKVWDISPDRLDSINGQQIMPGISDIKGHPLGKGTIVPGDKVALVVDAGVQMSGNNLVAKFGLKGLDKIQQIDSLTWKYQAFAGPSYTADGHPISQAGKLISEGPLPTLDKDGISTFFYLSSPRNYEPNVSSDLNNKVLYELQGETQTIHFLLIGEFDRHAGEYGDGVTQHWDEGPESTRQDALKTQEFDNLKFVLQQVRDTGAQFVS